MREPQGKSDALPVAHWMEKCSEARRERDAAILERDEARRMYVRLWTCEHGSITCDMLICAARKWGRNVALSLYPDVELRRQICADLFCGGLLDTNDEEELQEQIAENHRRLDEKFPEI